MTYTSKYLVVTWADRSPILFTRVEDGTYTAYDLSGTPDSSLDDWDISDAIIYEVN